MFFTLLIDIITDVQKAYVNHNFTILTSFLSLEQLKTFLLIHLKMFLLTRVTYADPSTLFGSKEIKLTLCK